MIKKILVATVLPMLCLSATAQISMNVDLLDNWNDTLIPNNGFGATYNEVWGFVQNGQEYGVIASTLGAHIFSITANDELDEVAMIPGAFQGTVIHRDYHDYNGYLYAVCQQGASTLQIIDLSDLPNSAPVVYDSDVLVSTAHDIFIDTATAKLYVSSPPGVALQVYSLADPTDPQFLFQFAEVDFVHDCFVRNDTAYLNCGTQGLYVYDFSDSQNPQLLGSLTSYPDQGYNHAGWASTDGNTYVFSDETLGMKMKVCDVSDLADIQVQGLFNSGEDSATVPHNLMLKEGIVYVSHYNDGLQIFDVSDPFNPIKVGYYDTFTDVSTSHFKGAWGIYAFLPSGRLLISDRQTGLYLFQFNNPVGVDEQAAELDLKLFPNPNNGTFYLEGEMVQGKTEIGLFDVSGKQVLAEYENSPTHIQISTKGLSKGLYLLKVISQAGVKSLPVVIK